MFLQKDNQIPIQNSEWLSYEMNNNLWNVLEEIPNSILLAFSLPE